jgi:hypothetical protein
MSRAAILFVGATVAASCGGTVASEPSDGGGEAATDSGGGELDGQAVVMYGPGPVYRDAAPSVDARPDAPSQNDAATDAPASFDGAPVMYGPAVIDSGGG